MSPTAPASLQDKKLVYLNVMVHTNLSLQLEHCDRQNHVCTSNKVSSVMAGDDSWPTMVASVVLTSDCFH